MTDFDEKRALADVNHQNALSRQREAREARDRAEARKIAAKSELSALAQTGNLEAMRLAHELDGETRERDFLDRIREENLRLQSLVKETQMAQIDRTHESQTRINELTKEAIIRLVERVLAKRLGVTDQQLEGEKLAKQERVKHQLERDADADLADQIAKVREKLAKM